MKKKILIFSHLSDIDGMGGVVLAKLAFDEIDYCLCETFSLLGKIKEKINDKSIYKYDQIFITDMWLEDPDLIKQDHKLKDRVLVFDHHESALAKESKSYNFITIRIKDKLGKCSGTSLFYEYLYQNKLLPDSKSIARFVELTRLYDTWEWVTVKNEPMAKDLTTLFNSVGPDTYIDMMYQKLKNNYDTFEFDQLELNLIKTKNVQIANKLQNYANKILIKEIMNLRAGIVFIDYEYRNDLAQYLRDIKIDVDFVMMIAMDYGTISYRNIVPGINVRIIAEAFGGKGHDYAASSPISKKTIEKIISAIIENKD